MGEEHRQRPQRTRRGFTKEFKRDAVELVRSTGRPIAAVARELGIYDSTLGNWVRQDRIDRGEAEGLTTEERARLRQVVAACRAAGVSVSAFYAWAAQREQRQRVAEHAQAELVAKIRTIHAESAGTYGSPRVTAELGRRGWRVNHKRVERLMAAHGIVGHRPGRRRGLTKADTATHPRRIWWAGCLPLSSRTASG